MSRNYEPSLINTLQFYQLCIDDGSLLPDNYYTMEGGTVTVEWDNERGCMEMGYTRWVAYYEHAPGIVTFAQGTKEDMYTEWLPHDPRRLS